MKKAKHDKIHFYYKKVCTFAVGQQKSPNNPTEEPVLLSHNLSKTNWKHIKPSKPTEPLWAHTVRRNSKYSVLHIKMWPCDEFKTNKEGNKTDNSLSRINDVILWCENWRPAASETDLKHNVRDDSKHTEPLLGATYIKASKPPSAGRFQEPWHDQKDILVMKDQTLEEPSTEALYSKTTAAHTPQTDCSAEPQYTL